MERLIHHVYLELAKEFNVWVVGPKGCEAYLDAQTMCYSTIPTPLSQFLLAVQWQAMRAARQFRPRLVLSGSGLTAPAALLAGRRTGAVVAGYVHGLDLMVKSLLYQSVFVPAIRSWDGILANSRYTLQLAQRAGIDSRRVRILNPGTSFPPSPSLISTEFRDRLGLGSRPILLSVGRLTARKGIGEFIQHCLPSIVRELPEVVFVVIGDDPKDAAQKTQGSRAGIIEAVRAKNLERNVLLLNSVDDATLSQAYASSQALVFPVLEKEGDVEGFGMVAVEAAAHGLPTVAFAVGGVPDAVQDGVSGSLIPPGDYLLMAKSLLGYLRKEVPGISAESSRNFAERFSWERFGKQLRQICTEWISNGKR
jgi:phosphatidylinositol alpha-1,6-mannosyltransferase